MTELPWNRFPEDRPAVELPVTTPEEPVELPPTRPPTRPPSDIDWADVLDDAWPAIKEQAIGYARDSARAIIAGKAVDVLNPTITATDMTGRELVVADAKSRSWRTLVQGLMFDVFAAVVAGVAVLSGADPFVKETWIAFGVLIGKSVVSAVISYFMRLRIAPTIRTEGEKMALMPVPRPMFKDGRKEHAA